jgi:DNA-binding CsgD family transcriptional regulator/tetratricopeptide (TPR) repeat protein
MPAGRLLEREGQLAALGDALVDARAGRGRLLLVRGEAGIGKTALVDRFCAEVRGARVLVGYCDLLATPRPLGPILDITGRLRGPAPPSRSDDGRQAVLRTLLDELAASTWPTIVVVEDAHWADEATLDVVRHVGRRLDGLHALVVVTYRDDELGPTDPLRALAGDLATSPAVTALDLAPLSPAAVAELAGALDEGLAEGVYDRTAGNPFFVSEVVAAGGLELPTTIRDAVLARASRLPAPSRPVVEAAAVLPTRAEIELLLTVSGAAEADLDACVTGGMLRPDRPGTVAFRHELARQAIAASLPPGRRAALHAAVVGHLLRAGDGRADPARVAHHAEQAGDGAVAATSAIAAAERAVALGAHREAAAQYERALRHAEHLPPEQRAATLAAYADQADLLDRPREALEAAGQALALRRQGGDRRAVGDALRRLADATWSSGDSGRARQLGHEAIGILEEVEPGPELAAAYASAATQAMLARDHANTLRWGRKAIELAERLGIASPLMRALNAVGSTRILDGDRGGEEDLRRSIQLAEQEGHDSRVCVGLVNLGSGSGEVRVYDVAEDALVQAIAVATDHDLDGHRNYATAWLARVRLERGDWAGAEALLRTLALDDPSGSPVTRIVALTVRGRLRARSGKGEPWTDLEEAARLAQGTADLQRLWPVAAARAEAWWLAGRPERIPAELDPVLPVAETCAHPWAIGELQLWRRRAQGSRPAGAAQGSGPSGATQGSGPAGATPASTMAAPFALELEGRPLEAADAWRALGCPYEAADALARTGEVDRLREALAVFDDLGALPAAAAVRRELRALGERRIPRGPRSATSGHPAGLTARQAEVLDLLCDGLSDAAIAQRLHLSVKTVGHHVSAILGKLEVDSRGEAAAVARRRQI